MAVCARVAYGLSRHYHKTATVQRILQPAPFIARPDDRQHERQRTPRQPNTYTQGTLFTAGNTNITQENLVKHLATKLALPADAICGDDRAMVILASPKYAQLVTDVDCLTDLIKRLRDPKDARSTIDLDVLGAVVDGVAPEPFSHHLREGVSILIGSRKAMLPYLWTRTDPARFGQAEDHPAHVTFSYRTQEGAGHRVSLTLPLSNTLFINGRRSTLTVFAFGPGTSGVEAFELQKMAPKKKQIIQIQESMLQGHSNIADTVSRYEKKAVYDRPAAAIRAPLVPITQPRKILEGLGNIVAKIEINGAPAPASAELQANIDRLLNADKPWSDFATGRSPVAVWAMVMPAEVLKIYRGLEHRPEAVEEALDRFCTSVGLKSFGPQASRQLAFDMGSRREWRKWQASAVLTRMLGRGCRLHKILSGGGEWGAKASLLSLDPQTTYKKRSEEDELKDFQKSFRGDLDAADSIVRPGDFVQFFIRDDASDKAYDKFRANLSGVSVGVVDPSSGKDAESLGPLEVWKGRFGAVTTQSVYAEGARLKTKLDTPGAVATLTNAALLSDSDLPAWGRFWE